MRLILSSICILLMFGCNSTTPPPEEKPALVLPWPMPMATCEISSIVVTQEGKVQMDYVDNINIAVCERDMLRYIKDLTEMVCKHQPGVKECLKK